MAIEGLFVTEDLPNFGADYDKTHLTWFHNFNKNWPKIKEKYPDPFFRMWKYNLFSFACAFRARSIQLWQIELLKDGILNGYQSAS